MKIMQTLILMFKEIKNGTQLESGHGIVPGFDALNTWFGERASALHNAASIAALSVSLW